MIGNWREWRARNPRLFTLVVTAKKLRTKVALLLLVGCVIKGAYWNEPPFDLDEPNGWVFVGLALVVIGVGIRIAAYGVLRKKGGLATTGVYSLLRHPLYLGSMLMTYGFCVLLDDPENFVVATAYFGLFYTLAILWENVRLTERYGAEWDEYQRRVPALLPVGAYLPGGFQCRRAMRRGGALLVVTTAMLIAVVEVMAEVMRR